MTLFAICCYVLMSDFNTSSVNASAKCEVSFHFDGLHAIAFGDPSKISNGILNAHHHNPKVEIKEIEKGNEKVLFSVEGQHLYKKVLNISMPNKQLYPKRYYSVDMNKDKQDSRWCLDMESDLFQKELYLKDNFFTKIHFNVGTFYAENVTEEKYQFVVGSKIHSFNRQIGRPNLRVDLSQNDDLVINGLSKLIKLPYKKGINYSVVITNLPPKDMMDINHFVFYYDLLKTDVPNYMPVAVKKAAFRPYPIVCDGVIFSKSVIK